MTDAPGTILVVEDDDDIRDLLAELLVLHGFVVHTAVNGLDALTRLQTVAPAAILLDLMMPVMDGLEFLRQFRQRWPESAVPILLLTAASLDPDRVSELNGYTVIKKPVGVETLFAHLGKALGTPLLA